MRPVRQAEGRSECRSPFRHTGSSARSRFAARRVPRTIIERFVLADKDWRGVLTALSRVVDTFILTDAPTAPASRAWDREAALAFARHHGWAAIAEPDFDRALLRATEVSNTVIVTGSFHTVGDAMARLNVDPVDG